MTSARLVMLALAIVVVACGGIPPTPPTQTVDLAHNEFGDFVLLLFDESGLVTAARASDDASGSDPSAVARPESNEIVVSWLGGACKHGPRLALTGDSAALTLDLDIDPLEPSVAVAPCPAVGIHFGVTLTLSEPVVQNGLTLRLLSR